MATTDESRPAPPQLADGDHGDHGDHGRIGYGRLGRFTPLALAALLLLSLGAIGLAQRGEDGTPPPGGGTERTAGPVGALAPDLALPLLDGTSLRLADLRGSIVVLNFWASWCAPCREEMPVLQRFHEEITRSAAPVAVVGVGVRLDRDGDARALVQNLGLTYPLGRDTATDEPGYGPIQIALGIPDFLPATVFVRPDGIVDRLHVGPLTDEQLRAAVEAAGAPPSTPPDPSGA